MFKAAVFPDEGLDSRYSNTLCLALMFMTHMQFGVLPLLGNAQFWLYRLWRTRNCSEGRFKERVSADDHGLMAIGN